MNFPLVCYELAKLADGDGDTEKAAPVESEDDQFRKPKPLVKAAKVKKDELPEGVVPGAAILAGGAVARPLAHSLMLDSLRGEVDPASTAVQERLRATSTLPIHGPEHVSVKLPESVHKLDPAGARQTEVQATKHLRSDLSGNAAFIEGDSGILSPSGKKDFVVLGKGNFAKKPEILAHELGHGAIHQSGVGRLIQNKPFHLLGKATTFSPGGLPLAGAGIGAATGLSDNETVQRIGRWAPLIASAPNLLSEGGASALGLMKMRRAGASGGQIWNAAKSTLLPAFGTYAAPVALSTGAAHLGQAATRAARERLKEKDKTASKNVTYLLDQISKEPKVRPSQAEAPEPKYRVKQGMMAAMLDEMLKLNGMATTPKGRLHSTQIVGQPKEGDSSGPSTSSLSKPYGYGHVQPGTAKNTI